MITAMVINGFSLLEIRKLYIDELYRYHEELIFNLEQVGKIKEGTYDKIINDSKEVSVEHTVSMLKKQLFKAISNKKTK